MKKLFQIHALTIISVIFLCLAQSTKGLHEYTSVPKNEPVTGPTHETESSEEKTSITNKEITTHNQNATNVVNTFLPDTAKQPVVNNPTKPDTMGGGLDLGAPHKALNNDDYKTIQKTGVLDASSDSVANYNKPIIDKKTDEIIKDETYEISSDGKTTVFNKNNKPTKVQTTLNSGTRVTTELDPETGKKVNTTITTAPVKTGWFSTKNSSTVIHHHDDGTHTAITTTTTSGLFSPLFGSKTSKAVVKIDQAGNKTPSFTPGTKTSRNWDGSTMTTTVNPDGSTNTEVKSLFGSSISKSGTDIKGQPINAYDAQGIEE